MERPTPHNHGGEDRPNKYQGANSYGTDDPETQAHIENARFDSTMERRRNRERLERMVELGIDPDDAETVIEFEGVLPETEPDAQWPAADSDQSVLDDEDCCRLCGAHFSDPCEPECPRRSPDDSCGNEHPEPQEYDHLAICRTDLAKMMELTQAEHGRETLTEFAGYLRSRPHGITHAPLFDEPATKRYTDIGTSREDAATLAGYEKYLRTQTGESIYHPRIYVADVASHQRGIRHGLWIDANQNAEELEGDIAAMLDSSPTLPQLPWTQAWIVEATKDFAGLDLHGFTDTTLVAKLAKGVADFGAAYSAYVEIVGTTDPDMLDRFEDFYVGSYESPEAWAKHTADDMEWPQQLDRDVADPLLRRFVTIDYKKMASEARESWDIVTGINGRTYVFMR